MKKEATAVAKKAYEGLVLWGKFRAVFGAAAVGMAGLIMVAVGIWLITKKDPKTAKADAVVDSAECTRMPPGRKDGKPRYDCRSELSFQDGAGNSLKSRLSTNGDKRYEVADRVRIRYDPRNPTEVSTGMKESNQGLIVLAVGLLVITSASGALYFTLKHKGIAAVSGAGNILGRLF